MTTIEDQIRYQIGDSRPDIDYIDQQFDLAIQIFRAYPNRRKFTIHPSFQCSWKNLPFFITAHLIKYQPPLQSFWIFAITRMRPHYLKILQKERH